MELPSVAELAYRRQHASDWSRRILPLRRQAEVTNGWLRERLQRVLPEVMRSEGIDLWIVAARDLGGRQTELHVIA
jgi:hypothetical protein